MQLHLNGFVLIGRAYDMIKVAGKRQTLSGLNCILSEVTGVREGVFVIPESPDKKLNRDFQQP